MLILLLRTRFYLFFLLPFPLVVCNLILDPNCAAIPIIDWTSLMNSHDYLCPSLAIVVVINNEAGTGTGGLCWEMIILIISEMAVVGSLENRGDWGVISLNIGMWQQQNYQTSPVVCVLSDFCFFLFSLKLIGKKKQWGSSVLLQGLWQLSSN